MAHRLADLATDTVLPYQGRPGAVRPKPDGTQVSDADLAVEAALVGLLRVERPDDDVLSEERGGSTRGTARRWILEPIDGTEPFLAGERAWGTHVALEVDGQVVVAMITRPTERRRWWAGARICAWTRADPADRPATRLTVSTTTRLADARIGGFARVGSRLQAAVVAHAHWVADPLGDVIALVEGRVDAVLAPAGELWDHAPQVLIVTEAGGRDTDRRGGNRPDARGGLYTIGRVDDELCAVPELAVRV